MDMEGRRSMVGELVGSIVCAGVSEGGILGEAIGINAVGALIGVSEGSV